MQNPRLATRYAKSLLDLAVERNSVEDTLKDMQLLHSICVQSNDFVIMLRSPVISSDKKLKVISLLLEGRKVSELTNVFVKLLVSKGRELNLPEITVAFQAQYNELKHIRTVTLTTASAMSDAVKKTLEGKIAAYMPGDTVDLKTVVDEKLIGGFVLELEDKLYDASVRKGLNDIRATVIDKSYESKIG